MYNLRLVLEGTSADHELESIYTYSIYVAIYTFTFSSLPSL